MGANYVSYTTKSTTRAKALKEIRDYIEQSKHDYGRSYSGEMGMADGVVITDKSFDSEREAEDWLWDNAEKWGPALGIKLPDGRYVFGCCAAS